MEQLIELFQKIQELAGVGVEALQAAVNGEGGAPPEGAPPAGGDSGPPPGEEPPRG